MHSNVAVNYYTIFNLFLTKLLSRMAKKVQKISGTFELMKHILLSS